MVIHTNSSNSIINPEVVLPSDGIASGMTQMQVKQKATNVLNALKKKQKQNLSNPNQSLELLRLNIQYSFDLEIDQLMKKYVQLFFLPAIANINSIQEGENVSEAQLQKLCICLLENSKKQYKTDNISSPITTTPKVESDSDSSTENNNNTTSLLLRQALKRKRTETETENLIKRQFFLTTHPPNHYFSATNQPSTSAKHIFKPTTTSLLTSALTRPTNIGVQQHHGTTFPAQGFFTKQQGPGNTKPIFHIIQTNRNFTGNISLRSCNPELSNLLQSSTAVPINSNISSTTTATIQHHPLPQKTIVNIVQQSKKSPNQNQKDNEDLK